eukprot:TRINITY_DN832_c0_g1_i4.p1 TRINITY_DN832_c0_g1~~TRINITY_DN832_c0_g1_i4.p1  ORF type:complete len:154 (-),score=25.43 TRINITY_DN832_c0_g1_i4:53-514(-)
MCIRDRKEHRNTHTSEKPYVCGVSGCQERFSQTGKLSLHRRTHPEYKLKQYHSSSSCNKEIIHKKEMAPVIEKVGSVVHKENIMTSSGEEQVNSAVACNVNRESRVVMQDKMARKGEHADFYLWYLNCLQTPISLIVRPILPQPEKLCGKYLS